MEHWKRTLIPQGFEWKHHSTNTCILVRVQDGRWTATLSLRLASGEWDTSRFFVEDAYDASLQKCLLYVWRALSHTDRATFKLQEALADLRRFAR